jgi:hypothetical protein
MTPLSPDPPLALRRSAVVGIVSDTHGHLSLEAAQALDGVDLILHAGDIDTPRVLDLLSQLAPVQAVRGNMDHGSWARSLPAMLPLTVARATIYIVHDLSRIDLEPMAAGIHVVISGHTHRSALERRGGVLYLNPGSASFPRHGTSSTVARLVVNAEGLEPEIIRLE